MEKDKHCKIQSNLGSDTCQDVDKALFEMEHPFTIKFHLGVKKSTDGFEFVGGITRENKYVTPDSVTYNGLIADLKGFGFRLKRMWHETPSEDRQSFTEIKSDEQVEGILQLASNRGSIDLYVEGEVDSESSNSECFEAPEYRRQMKDGRDGQYGSVDGGKTESMEDRKDKDYIGKLTNQNDVVHLSSQRCEGVEHYERPCNATTEIEDKRDISSVKRARTMETDRVPAKRGRGSGTPYASNPGMDTTKRGRARGTASSLRNSTASRSGRDAASTSDKGMTSNSGRGIVSSSQNSTTLSSERITNKMAAVLRSGTDKGSSSAKAESQASRS